MNTPFEKTVSFEKANDVLFKDLLINIMFSLLNIAAFSFSIWVLSWWAVLWGVCLLIMFLGVIKSFRDLKDSYNFLLLGLLAYYSVAARYDTMAETVKLTKESNARLCYLFTNLESNYYGDNKDVSLRISIREIREYINKYILPNEKE
jgi:hypothetical protein